MAIYNFVDFVAGAGASGDLTAAGEAYLSGNAGDIGLWNVGAGTYMSTGGAAFAATDFLTDTWGSIVTLADTSSAGTATVQQVAIVPESFQMTQQRSSGQAFVTPIIKREDVKSIEYRQNVVPAAQTDTVTVNTIGGATHKNAITLTVTSIPTWYNEVENSNTPQLYNRVGEVFYFELTGDGSSGTTTTTAAQAFVDAINANTKCPVGARRDGSTVIMNPKTRLNPLGTSGASAATLVEAGCTWKTSLPDVDSNASDLSVALTTQHAGGEGTMEQVKSLERRSLANFGYHNRMWFKQEPAINSVTAQTNGILGFDLIQIKARVDGYGGSIGKKGREDMTVNIWWDALAASASGDLMDIVFRFTYGTNRKHEFNYSGVSQPTAGTGAGI